MEMILRLYLLPYNPARPVVCFDERPCFLIGNTVQNLEMKPGQVTKENFEYTKHGSCNVLAAIEPKTGRRFAHVRKRRTKREFAYFMRYLAKQYPNAEKIVVVLDNLNTHTFASFYDFFDAAEAEALVQRFEFRFTPKKASWLNMIEIEFSALARQCLNRRIDNINELATEVFAYFKERTEKAIMIDWQFSIQAARKKLNRHYTKVNPENQKYK